MERITSFSVDHNKLEPGVYISRIDGDITTYDLRFIKPNTPPFLDINAMHTIEHLFATYARNGKPVQTKLNVATTLHMMLKKHIIP